MPTFILGAAFGGSSCQFLLRYTFRAILSGKKSTGILSDYFRLGITKDVLGAAIPIRYQSIRIGHENRIVANVFYRFPINVFRATVVSAAIVFGCHTSCLRSLSRFGFAVAGQQSALGLLSPLGSTPRIQRLQTRYQLYLYQHGSDS